MPVASGIEPTITGYLDYLRSKGVELTHEQILHDLFEGCAGYLDQLPAFYGVGEPDPGDGEEDPSPAPKAKKKAK